MAWFETLNSNETGDLYLIMTGTNRISENIFMPIILLVIFFVLLLGFVFSGKSIWRGLLYSSFVCSILSSLMVIMNWLAVQYMYFSFFLLAVSALAVWLSEAFS